MNVLTLGVETSGTIGAVALRRDGRTVESISLQQVGRRHAQTLISEVDAMLRRAGVESRQLEVVATSIGPGSFTGLRVGVVFAKTLAYAVGCRLVAVDTLRAIAANSPADVSEVFVVSDAQRGDLFVGQYLLDGSIDSPRRIGDVVIESGVSFRERIVELAASRLNLAISGPSAEAIRATLPPNLRVLPAEFQQPRADILAQLGEQQASSGEVSDPWLLEPFYLRRSAAEEKAAS